jgi:putative protease
VQRKTDIKMPELLSPAGDKERLDACLMYGADAVYLGADMFSMRAAAPNFEGVNLEEAVRNCHSKGVKVYLTCNTLPRNNEIALLQEYLEKWESIGIDALIVADFGVLDLCKKYVPSLPVHISTQAGIVNYHTAETFYNLGASRVVLARELSLSEIAEIAAKKPKELEIEAFVHGAMCVSFSGRCLLSNYLTGRDANRGECAQPCRWEYALMEKKRDGMYFPISEDKNGTYILNSRDMCMIEHIPELVKAGIDSFKIEGRAKSSYYAAVITNAYRAAIDEYFSSDDENYVVSDWIKEETGKVSYREYCTGFYFGSPSQDAQIFYDGGYKREWDVAAVVIESDGEYLTVEQRNKFIIGDELEIIEPGKIPEKIVIDEMLNGKNEPVTEAPHPMEIIKIKTDKQFVKGSLLRKQKN